MHFNFSRFKESMNLSELLIIFVNKSAYHTIKTCNEIFFFFPPQSPHPTEYLNIIRDKTHRERIIQIATSEFYGFILPVITVKQELLSGK